MTAADVNFARYGVNFSNKNGQIVNILTTPSPVDRKLFAGPRVRRLRQGLSITQSRMAQDLGLSVSYLNLLERNQRPLTAAVLLKLADVYDVDVRQFTSADTDRRTEDVAQALAGSGAQLPRSEIREFSEQFPEIAAALLRLASAAGAPAQDHATSPFSAVRAVMLDHSNHFHSLDVHAEQFADELKLTAQPLESAVRERLRTTHGLGVRLLPTDVMPDKLFRLDYHNRQLLLSEALDPAGRCFQMCLHLAQLEAQAEIDAEVAAARTSLAESGAMAPRLFSRMLSNYWAAALIMPYSRFHAAAESSGYDMEILQSRFSASFEQVAHRLSTLQRPGLRGIPFQMIRVDRAGQVSKRFSAGQLPFAVDGGQCPLWIAHAAFATPGRIVTQLAEVDAGERIFTFAQTVAPYRANWGATQPEFVIALSCSFEHARALAYADMDARAVPIGPGCAACTRTECTQRSLPPAQGTIRIEQGGRGLYPFAFDLPGSTGEKTA